MALTSDAAVLISERKKTHGNWEDQAKLAFGLKALIRSAEQMRLTTSQAEALDMICVKISRIVTGDTSLPDHWDDIAGYALLGKQGHD